jgi:ferric-dicitrate binding protein FerR (iron transport regulator)
MNPHDDDLDTHFKEAWREWTQRQTSLSAAAAAARVRARLAPRSRYHRWVYAAAAALICASAGLSYLWLFSRSPILQPAAVTQQMAPLGEGEVLMWLDEKTPLYMNFQPPGGSRVP